MDWAKEVPERNKNHLIFVIWWVLQVNLMYAYAHVGVWEHLYRKKWEETKYVVILKDEIIIKCSLR